MGINNLPKPGINFRATLGPGSFQRKLSSATQYGGLQNLRDNQKTIVEAIKKYQGAIRVKGGLSRLQQREAWLKIKASDKTITKEDTREIKEVLKHLSRGTATVQDKIPIGSKAVKTSDGRGFLSKEQIARNLRARQQKDKTVLEEKYNRTNTSVLGKVGGGVHGDASRLGVGIKQAQVRVSALNLNSNKLPNNPAPSQASPIGIKPLGM